MTRKHRVQAFQWLFDRFWGGFSEKPFQEMIRVEFIAKKASLTNNYLQSRCDSRKLTTTKTARETNIPISIYLQQHYWLAANICVHQPSNWIESSLLQHKIMIIGLSCDFSRNVFWVVKKYKTDKQPTFWQGFFV